MLFSSGRQRDELIYLKLDQDETGPQKRTSKGRKYLTLLLLTGMISFVAFVGVYAAFHSISKKLHSYNSSSAKNSNPILLVSIDGFRYDFLYRGLTPNLAYLARNGMHGPLHPQFPSYTFPNHFSLVTGLYPESHGIVANAFYDPDLNDYFSYTDQKSLRESKWWEAEPIWNTVQSYGMKSATMFWPGSESAIGGRRPNYYRTYNGNVSHRERVDQILKWLSLPSSKRPDFLSLYLSAVDEAGHNFGPDSVEINQALKDVDQAIGILMTGLKNRELLQKVNLLVVSDHGMIEVKHHIYLDDLIEDLEDRVEWVDYGPVASIKPAPGEEDDIYATLKFYQSRGMKYSVYRHQEIPHYFHYRNNDRIAPIIMVAESGWVIDFKGGDWVPKGAHGYDPRLKDMQALFIGTGPDFPTYKGPVTGVNNLDVYPLMMHLLNIPALPNNGTMKLVDLTN